MDLLLEGIMIAIMMAIILFFVVYEYSAFFAPKSSTDYYSNFVGMTGSACTSIQTASNVQFSSPEIFVFQFYDSGACNSVLSSNTNVFSPTSSSLSALQGNYALCYATVSNPGAIGLSSGDQYYLQQQSNQNVNFYLSKDNAIVGSGNLSADAINNQIATSGVEVNSSKEFSITLTAKAPIDPQNYTFKVDQYSNATVDLQFFFNGLSTCSLSYSDIYGTSTLSIVPPCQQNINNITIQVSPVSDSAFNYQVNMTAVPNSNSVQTFLAQQCTSLPSLVDTGIIDNGSIVCRPISCGGTSFMLTDQSNRPFLGLYGGSYTFFGLQSGIDDLQIVNSYPEQLLNSSLMSRTVFEESGLTAGSSWSVTYDKQTKSSSISLTGSGNTISFSVPPGNYSFSVPSTSVIIGKTRYYEDPYGKPSVYSGYAVQGSFVFISFIKTIA